MTRLLTVLLLGTATILAKDLGVTGQTFPIVEESLLEVIQTRLKGIEQSGRLKGHQKIIQERVQKTTERPAPVALPHAEECRSHLYDPTLVIAQDIVDHQQNIIAPKGTTINPLDTVLWGNPFVFIDGDDKRQVAWAMKQPGKIVLINGAPLVLAKAHNKPFYFDQGGALTRRFDITGTPARVSQQGKALLVEELNLETCR